MLKLEDERIQMVCILRYYFLTLAIYNHRKEEKETVNERVSEWVREKEWQQIIVAWNYLNLRDRCCSELYKIVIKLICEVQMWIQLCFACVLIRERGKQQAQIELRMSVQLWEDIIFIRHLLLFNVHATCRTCEGILIILGNHKSFLKGKSI